jgi:hypothetical protein
MKRINKEKNVATLSIVLSITTLIKEEKCNVGKFKLSLKIVDYPDFSKHKNILLDGSVIIAYGIGLEPV